MKDTKRLLEGILKRWNEELQAGVPADKLTELISRLRAKFRDEGMCPVDHHEVGQASEDYVDGALYALRNDGIIHEYWRTKRFSDWDRQGVDFWVQVIPGGRRMPLQVKSSARGAEDHRKHHPGGDIPCIVAQKDIKTRLTDIIVCWHKKNGG